ncbi:VanW family protein [Sporosarcina siberiensis]|uniref:VanW family protein n=1 Tax=Sporosarcina siberiensis TaxID=1365606 RepID=A0ABW4SD53_9BACL
MKLKYYFPIVTWSILILFVLTQTLIPVSVLSAESDSKTGMIANIEIESRKKSEIQAQLIAEVEKWKANDIIVHGTTAKIVIPSTFVKFDIQKTVNHYITVTSKPWYQFWGNTKNIQIPIELTLDEDLALLLEGAPLFYKGETIAAIGEHASLLKYDVIVPAEVPLTKDIMDRISFETQSININENGILQIVEALNETTVLNGESYSFLQTLETTNAYFNDETANFVASTLYSTVLQSELDIKERHSQNVLPNYLQPGVEAKVDQNRNQDLAFVNQTNRPVTIYASVKEGRLLIELYSLQSDTNVSINVMNKEIVLPRTIYRLTPTLAAGQENMIEDGSNGLRVQIYRTFTNGSYEKDELISRDFYPPKNKVILVSSLEPPVSNVNPDGTLNPPGTTTEQPSDSNENGTINDIEGNGNSNTVDPNENELEEESDDKVYDKGGNLIPSSSK